MTMSTFLKRELPALLVLAAPFVAMPFLWDDVPAEVPMQWNLAGDVNWYGPRWMAILLLPLLNVGLYLLFTVLPNIDPKRRLSLRAKPLPALRFYTLLALLLIWVLHLHAVTQENPFEAVSLILLVATVLLLVVGNYLSAVPPNYFVGIRTPWTLEHPEVWRRTHRAMSRVWVFVTAAMIVLWKILDMQTYVVVFTVGAIGLAVGSLIYSYVVYRQERAPA